MSENPRPWLEKTFANPRMGRNFDLAADGKRMVALIPVELKEDQISNHHVIFLENFFDELRRRTKSQ